MSTCHKFIQDFKSKFVLEKKVPEYYLGAGIVQDDSGAIHLDSSKYVRKMLVKYDMDRAVCLPLPMPAGTIVTCQPTTMTLTISALTYFNKSLDPSCTAVYCAPSSSSTRLSSTKS